VCLYVCDHRNPEKGPYVPVGNDRKMNESSVYILRLRSVPVQVEGGVGSKLLLRLGLCRS
jgi:hypothetical protein